MSLTESNEFALIDPVITAPSWWGPLAEKTWTEIVGGSGFGAAYQNGARLNDVKYTPPLPGDGSGIVTGFTGACMDDTRGEMLLWCNGGHASYSGNECYAVNFRDEVPYCYMVIEPSPIVQFGGYTGTNYRGSYDDGLRKATHNYNFAVYDPIRDMVVMPFVSGIYNEANNGTSGAMWTLDRGRAAVYGSYPVPYSEVVANAGDGPGYHQYRDQAFPGASWSPTYTESPVGVWNPVNQTAIAVTKWPTLPAIPTYGNIWEMDPSVTTTWTTGNGGLAHYTATYDGSPGNFLMGGSGEFVIDDTSPPLLVCPASGNGNGQTIAVMDLSNPGTFRMVTMSGATAPSNFVGYGGVYHRPSRAGLLANNGIGRDFYKIKIDDPANPLTSGFTLSLVTGAGATPTSDAASRYTRFNIIHDMGDGQAALVYVGNMSAPSYILKLPAGEVT